MLLAGAATEMCIVQTAIDAREIGLKVTILASACATVDPDDEDVGLATPAHRGRQGRAWTRAGRLHLTRFGNAREGTSSSAHVALPEVRDVVAQREPYRMTVIGIALSCEERSGPELIEAGRMAEEAGFGAGWISDHFHPWNDAQGQSPFVWSVLGALSQVTSSMSWGPRSPARRCGSTRRSSPRRPRRPQP